MELAKRKPQEEEDFDDALIEACEDVATLHLLEDLQIVFDAEAKRLSDGWFTPLRDTFNERRNVVIVFKGHRKRDRFTSIDFSEKHVHRFTGRHSELT